MAADSKVPVFERVALNPNDKRELDEVDIATCEKCGSDEWNWGIAAQNQQCSECGNYGVASCASCGGWICLGCVEKACLKRRQEQGTPTVCKVDTNLN